MNALLTSSSQQSFATSQNSLFRMNLRTKSCQQMVCKKRSVATVLFDSCLTGATLTFQIVLIIHYRICSSVIPSGLLTFFPSSLSLSTVIPKRNSVFSMEIGDFVTHIYGSKFELRSSERSAKKFKVKGTIDL